MKQYMNSMCVVKYQSKVRVNVYSWYRVEDAADIMDCWGKKSSQMS